jgi:hypothetical protein
MYLCYSDESGFNGKKLNPSQPVQVMAAILPNAYNFHRTDSQFKEIFQIINRSIPLKELKAEQIYRGRGAWNDIPAHLRDRVIEFYLNWISIRPHKLIISAIDNAAYFNQKRAIPDSPILNAIPYPYLLAGLQIAMVVQKMHRAKPKNKGKTLVIFDEQDQFEDDLTDLIFNPPDFIDSFVPFDPSKEDCRLCQIIDTCFFVKSHQSSMAQVVDIVAYLFRLKLELSDYAFDESYGGELDKVTQWLGQIEDKQVPFGSVYPRRRSEFTDFIRSVRARGI